jgi:diguanylate cyclase (GGDEF)-like protein
MQWLPNGLVASMANDISPPRQARQVVMAAISVLAILAAIAALSANVVVTMRDAANSIDENRSLNAVASAVSSIKKRMAVTVRDNAIWDDAYAAIGSAETQAWIDDNWGTTSEDYPLYDGVVVLDPQGKQISAYLKGKTFDALKAFGTNFADQARDASDHPSTNAHVGLFALSGETTMVSTLAIQPYYGKPPTPLYTLTFFKTLTPDYIGTIADDFQVKGLELSKNLVPSQLDYPLLDTRGEELAHLTWPKLDPGTAVYNRVFPQLVILAILFAIFLVLVIFHSRWELHRESARAAAATREATHDQLTGLLNRAGFIQAVARAPAGSIVHLIDLDGFKAVNDAWGHAVGDQLIRLVGQTLGAVHERVFAIARMGGDEFALIHPDEVDAKAVGSRIVHLLKQPFAIDGRTVEVGASVGFTGLTADQPALEVVRRADVALYHAKESGRGQTSAYSVELDLERENLADAERRLKAAIGNDEIGVVFQPLTSAASGKIIGVEALARWSPPTGPVSPEMFIPLAERSGLIDQLSHKVFHTALEAVRDWPELDLSLNVSPLQLCNPNFADEMKHLLASQNFDPHRLILEVTEGVFISKPDRAQRSITALHAIGVRFAMDDFGTGHASIGTLRQFGFDKVKIDRSLIAAGNDAILRATIQLAAALDIPVTAEGIETDEQAHFARDAGCELLQGYLIGKPMSLAMLKERLEPSSPAAKRA